MAEYISPIFDEFKPFKATTERFFTAFKPIQGTQRKSSEFFAYALTPFVDLATSPFLLLDAVINLCNFVATLAETAYYWTFNQKNSSKLIDRVTSDGLGMAKEQFLQALSAVVEALINPILSILSLVTRPISSVVNLVVNAIEECSESNHRFTFRV